MGMRHTVFENKAAKNAPPLTKIEFHAPQANIKVSSTLNSGAIGHISP
jgi:hypothetical protein